MKRKDVSKGKFAGIRSAALKANLDLFRHNLAVFTFGNASAVDRDAGVFAIKPSGVDYSCLKAEDMVVVDFEGHVVDGSLRPSSDTETHAFLYRQFPLIGGIVHTHSPYAVGWAQARQPIPILGTTHADHCACDIPCTAIMTDRAIRGNYEEETGKQIARRFENLDYREVEMALVACHGPFTWGKTADKAVYNAVILEELAKMAMITLSVAPDTPGLKKTLIDKHYFRKHGEKAYYGQR